MVELIARHGRLGALIWTVMLAAGSLQDLGPHVASLEFDKPRPPCRPIFQAAGEDPPVPFCVPRPA